MPIEPSLFVASPFLKRLLLFLLVTALMSFDLTLHGADHSCRKATVGGRLVWDGRSRTTLLEGGGVVLSREIHQLEARATLIEEEVKRDSPLEHNPGHEMSSAVDVSPHFDLKYTSGMYASELAQMSSAAAAGRSARARIARLIVATCRVALSERKKPAGGRGGGQAKASS